MKPRITKVCEGNASPCLSSKVNHVCSRTDNNANCLFAKIFKLTIYFTGNMTSFEMGFKLTIYFTGKCDFSGNGIQAYNLLYRKM